MATKQTIEPEYNSTAGQSDSSSKFEEVELQTGRTEENKFVANNCDFEAGKQKDETNHTEPPKSKYKFSGHYRHVVAILTLLSVAFANMSRQVFDQAMPRIIETKRESGHLTMAGSSGQDCLSAISQAGSLLISNTTEQMICDKSNELIYNWSQAEIGRFKSAFSLGYMILMLVSARLSEWCGAFWVVFICALGSSLCTIFVPLLVNNYSLLLASRFLLGLAQAGVSPSLYTICTRWTHEKEASVYVPMIRLAVMLGFLFGSLIGGKTDTWQMSFNVAGGLSILFTVLWFLAVTSEPANSMFVSKSELEYIETGRKIKAAPAKAEANNNNNTTSTNNNIPFADKLKTLLQAIKDELSEWLLIISNKTVFAFMLTKLTVKLSTDTQTTFMPLFLSKGLGLSDDVNSTLNSVNFGLQTTLTFFVAYSANVFIDRKVFGFGKTGARRFYQGITNFGTAGAYFMLANCSDQWTAMTAIMILSISSMFCSGGEVVLPIDITTDRSASIMAIANLTANLSGIFLPLIISATVDKSTNDWSLALTVVALISALGGILFCTLVEAKIQNFESKEKVIDESEKKEVREKSVLGIEGNNNDTKKSDLVPKKS